MDYNCKDEVMGAICLGTIIANFLLNTSRVLQGLELCRECVILFNCTCLVNEKEFFRLLCKKLCAVMLKGFALINDHKSEIEYGTEFMLMFEKFGLKNEEGEEAMELASLYRAQGNTRKAIELSEKALGIMIKIGSKEKEAECYRDLGAHFLHLGEYAKAEGYLQKGVMICNEIDNRKLQASCFRNLAVVFHNLNEDVQSVEYSEKALSIAIEINDRQGQASDYGNLGSVFRMFGKYSKSEEFLKKALFLRKETSDRQGEGQDYTNLGNLFQEKGEPGKAVEYYKKALSIRNEIGDKEGEAKDYINLGFVLLKYLNKQGSAKECFNKALAISKEIGLIDVERRSYLGLALAWFEEEELNETILNEAVITNLLECIQKSEEMRSFLKDRDQFKVSVFDRHEAPYRLLSHIFCIAEKPCEALYLVELRRARALAELISPKYSDGKMDPASWFDIGKVMKNETNCACLYITYDDNFIFFWILRGKKPSPCFVEIEVNERFMKWRVQNFRDFFQRQPTRTIPQTLTQENCEDRSLFPLQARELGPQSQKSRSVDIRLVENDSDEEDNEPRPTLGLLYQIIIAPVAEFLDESEIIIVPEPPMYKVPYAALKDEGGNYLSETFRIRIVPSLTILKLIQERPVSHCNDRSVLIVGDPDVSYVSELSQLSFARKEAEIIGTLLGVHPLLGCQATKQVVLEAMHSARLIHFAAHGDAERGEIALAPERPVNRILRQDDFLLKMSDVSEVQLSAKLVVLSCCHSAHGQIRAEGVVGIARAFLGSGARSVLVALWAIEDKATEQFMGRFYEHLVRGESASESLHQAMKWMRENGFPEVRQWAPFMLIGDNVTFDFTN